MKSAEKNMCILKQSNGVIWNFLYDKRLGIIYKIYKEDKWSNIIILTRKTTGKYSIDLLPDDTICLIYENLNGQLIMKLYNNKKWNSNYIIKNQDYRKMDIYFKTIFNKNELLLFYSIYNKENSILTLTSYIIDKNYNLSSQLLIDEFEFDHNEPFSISSAKDTVYIMYQKKEKDYILGYKLYNTTSKNCSDFYKIDDSFYPFEDYCLLFFKENFHSIYTKIDNNKTFLLTYYKNNLSSNDYITIYRSKNNFSSALFRIDKYIWCFWLKDTELFSTVSIDGYNSFSNPYQVEEVNNLNVYKVSYTSNFIENKNIKCVGEIFAININSPKLLVIDNIYELVYKHTEYSIYTFYLLYFISFLNTNDTFNNISYSEKDILIQKQIDIIEKQKNKLLSYENKFNSINTLITNFNENIYQLNEGISILQDTLDDKEKKYNELKKMYSEKEKELDLLKAKLNQIETQNSKRFNIKKKFAKLFFYKD